MSLRQRFVLIVCLAGIALGAAGLAIARLRLQIAAAREAATFESTDAAVEALRRRVLDLPGRPAAPARGDAFDGTDLDLRWNLEQLERKRIERALDTSKNNRAQAARLLGIRRALLYARMKHLGIAGGDAAD